MRKNAAHARHNDPAPGIPTPSCLSGGRALGFRNVNDEGSLRLAPILDARPERLASVDGTAASAPSPAYDRDDFYRGVIDGMRCGILSVDRAGKIVLVNQVACEMLELPARPEAGVSAEAAFAELPELAQILGESFGMASLPNRAEIEIRTGSGKTKTIGFTLSMVRNRAGIPVGAALFFKDLTYVEHREEQERLRDRLAALGGMSANLAHEIRNPLAGIDVSCSLLKRRLASDEASREILDKVLGEVRRLNRTLTSSLEFAKPLLPSLAPCTIETMLDDAMHVALNRNHGSGIAVEKSFAPGIEPFFGDREQLQRVFENLFINAFEAMGDQGRLIVTTGTVRAPEAAHTPYRPAGSGRDPWLSFDRYLVVKVSDTGPGIDEENRDKLFYPFFTTKKHGSGIGLPTARKIVDSHRGLIDYISEPGRGTTFTVRLPLASTHSRRSDRS